MTTQTMPRTSAATTTKPTGGLKRSLRLLYVYTLATGAIFTFMCYWDGIFLSYCGPVTFLGFILMTAMILPIGFVYAELSTMLPSTGSCLVFNTVGLKTSMPASGPHGSSCALGWQFPPRACSASSTG